MKIFVADSQDVLRRGLQSLLTEQPGWFVCGDAKSGQEAVMRILELKPDIVVFDVDLPDLDGIEATLQIKETLPATEVLFFTTRVDDSAIARALQAGARGYVLKSEPEEKLIEGIETIARHLPFFSSRVSEMLLNHFLNKNGASEEAAGLSGREREIVQIVSEGKSNKEIALRLHISIKTVETHRAAIMRKLGFNSITELVRYAIRNKIIEP